MDSDNTMAFPEYGILGVKTMVSMQNQVTSGYDSFQRLRGCVAASQFTVAPSSSASSVVLSSVASSRFFKDSCTRAAFLSFFSSDGNAAFLGGDIYIAR